MNVPPLHLLRSFSEVARTGSFSRAAEAMHVTQSAISQQMRQLEQMVGTGLFQRAGRGITLTDFGRVYLQLVVGPVAALEEGHTTLRAIAGRSSVVLRLSRSFGSLWLAPRMADLARAMPDISVTSFYLNPNDHLTPEGADALVISNPKMAGLSDFTLEPLFTTTLCPVAAPSLGPIDLRRLSDYPVIHTLRRHGDWQTWCDAAGLPCVGRDQGWTFESSSMSYTAAEHGLGIVMAELEFVEDALAQGRLRRLSEVAVPSGHEFHAAYVPARYNHPAVKKFRNWIMAQRGSPAGFAPKLEGAERPQLVQ